MIILLPNRLKFLTKTTFVIEREHVIVLWDTIQAPRTSDHSKMCEPNGLHAERLDTVLEREDFEAL